MKKFTLGFLSLAMLMLGMQSVFAADAPSEVSITFTPNDQPTGPLDPLDPDNPSYPGDPNNPETGMNGPLSIDALPKLPFGSQKITGKVEGYETTNLKPYIQVSDTRGIPKGWEVTATLGRFTSQTDASQIADAKLVFTSPEVKKPSTNNSGAPTIPATVELVSGGVGKPIFTAADGNGKGTWLGTWISSNSTNEKVKLYVNTSGVSSHAYTATINWSLISQP